jgi:hypothetical protein
MALTCSFLPFCCSSVSTKSLTVWLSLPSLMVKDNPILKGARYVFLKNTQNLTKKQLWRANRDNEILKKATALFAVDNQNTL